MTQDPRKPRGKVIYPTEHAAQRRALRRSAKAGIPLRVYPCRRCHGYHLTSKVDVRGEGV